MLDLMQNIEEKLHYFVDYITLLEDFKNKIAIVTNIGYLIL